MEFRVLGPLEIENDGTLLALGGAKQRALLAMLLMHANEVVSRDSLIEGLWGETAGDRASHSLEAQVSRLRKALRRDSEQILLTRPNGYMLSLGADQLDLFVFERLLEEGRSALETGAADDAAAALRRALALWRGRAFDDVSYEPFAQIEIERLEERRLEAIEDRIEADLAVGRDVQLASELEALVRKHPLRERFRGQLMLALYRSGRQAEALDEYQDARRALVDELGIEPGPGLRELEQAILRQDPELARVERRPDAVGRPGGAEQEKTVTVLFAEISAAGGGDDEDSQIAHRVIQGAGHELRVAVEYHGGTVERLTGDELMAVFGVPATHEDDVVRSARAALALREAVTALNTKLHGRSSVECRTAISTGVVRVAATSGRPELSGAVLGIVRRLAETVDRGEILLDAATAARGDTVLVIDAAELRALRGRPEPLSVVRLLGVAAEGEARPERMAPFVGREGDLRQLQSAFDRAVDEGHCVVATVLGEAGIGKSRLAAEFSTHLQETASVFTGRCVSYGEGVTFLPLAEIVAQAAGTRPREEIERLLAGEEDAGIIAKRVDDLVSGAKTEGSTGEAFWAVRRFFEGAARERPLLLVFEDVHWAEPTLLDLVEYLGRWSNQVPIMVLCLARPELLEERPGWVSDTSSIRLGPLSDEETQELVGHAGKGIGDELRLRIAQLAAGNPLFAEQLIVFACDDETEGLSAVPPSIEALLASRLDRLADSEQAVLRRAAVVGREFWHGAVLYLSPPIEVPSVGRLLLDLTRKGLVEPGTSAFPREDSFRFRHELIRDVAYNSIPEEVRSDLHERLVDWLDLHNRRPGRAFGLPPRAGLSLQARGRPRRRSRASPGHRCRRASRHCWTPRREVRRHACSVESVESSVFAPGHGGGRSPRSPDGARTGAVARGRGARRRGRANGRARSRRCRPGPPGRASRAPRACQPEPLPRSRRRGRRARRADGREHPDSRAARRRASPRSDLVRARVRSRRPSLPVPRVRRGSGAGDRLLPPLGMAHCSVSPRARGRPLLRADRRSRGHRSVSRAARRGRSWERGACPRLPGLPRGHGRALRLRQGSHRPREGDLRGARMDGERHDQLRALAADVEMLAGDYGAAERLLVESCGKLEEWGEQAHLATQASQLGEALFAQGRQEEALRWADLAAARGASDDASAQFSWRALRAKVRAHQGALGEAESLAREAVELAAATDALAQHAAVRLSLAEVLRIGGQVAAARETIDEAIDLLERKGNRAACRTARARLDELARN